MEVEAVISNISQFNKKEVTLKGWVYNTRGSGKISFLLLRDGTGIIQCVLFKGETPDEAFDAFGKLTQESAVEVTGTVREDTRSAVGFEIGVKKIKIVSIAEPYPIGKKEHGPDFLLGLRHLWIRSKLQHAVLRIRHEIIQGIHEYLNSNGFIQMDAPIFTPNACEGTSTLFQVNYFDEKAFLTQSGQLYGEAGAMAFRKIYTFGPTFRAEKSKTRRHLTEFWMIEPEMAFCDLEQNIKTIEGMISFVIQRTLQKCSIELKTLERDTSKLEKIIPPFPRMTYEDAAKILKGNPESQFKDGEDFGGPDETILASQHEKPVFVTHFPAAIKAFYMKRDEKRPDLTLSCDLLATEGYGEIVGGSQREDNLKFLEDRIREHKLNMDHFQWYLDLRRFGNVPHAGFGLGLERLVAWVCGTEHIRECIPFPRTIYRITP